MELLDFKPRHLHVVHRCNLQLEMLHIAWSACLYVCVLGTTVSCATVPEPIKMPFWEGGELVS